MDFQSCCSVYINQRNWPKCHIPFRVKELKKKTVSAIGEFLKMNKFWKLWKYNHAPSSCLPLLVSTPLIGQNVTYSRLCSVSAVLYVVRSWTFIYACECFRTGGSGTALAVCIIKGAVCILQSHYRRCLPRAVCYRLKLMNLKAKQLFWKSEEKEPHEQQSGA